MSGTPISEHRDTAPAKRVLTPEGIPLRVTRRPSYWAYQVLRVGFFIGPLVAGLDKFFYFLVPWDIYLAPRIEKALPFSGREFMVLVGMIEILAAILVAWRPRIGSFVVAAWLVGIMVNLLFVPGFNDIVLCDLILALGALALGLLSLEYAPSRRTVSDEGPDTPLGT